MSDSFIKKIEAVLRDLPPATEIAISLTDRAGTKFIGIKRENSGIKYLDNKTTAFEIGSVTKAFTGNVLAKLVADQKINLNETIASFLPFNLAGNPGITFRQLALHTSGLPRMPKGYDDRVDFIKENPFSNYDENALAAYLSTDLLLESLPDEKALYSNLGFGLLAYLISRIENKPFSSVVEEKIFQPLSMKGSAFSIKNISGPVIPALDKGGRPVPYWDGGIFNGSLGIISTAEDLSRFSKMALHCDDSICLQVSNTFDAKPDVKTCLGWLMVNFNNNDPVIKINGGTAGCSSAIFVNQKKQRAFTFCSNLHPDSYMELIEPSCIEAVI